MIKILSQYMNKLSWHYLLCNAKNIQKDKSRTFDHILNGCLYVHTLVICLFDCLRLYLRLASLNGK